MRLHQRVSLGVARADSSAIVLPLDRSASSSGRYRASMGRPKSTLSKIWVNVDITVT